MIPRVFAFLSSCSFLDSTKHGRRLSPSVQASLRVLKTLISFFRLFSTNALYRITGVCIVQKISLSWDGSGPTLYALGGLDTCEIVAIVQCCAHYSIPHMLHCDKQSSKPCNPPPEAHFGFIIIRVSSLVVFFNLAYFPMSSIHIFSNMLLKLSPIFDSSFHDTWLSRLFPVFASERKENRMGSLHRLTYHLYIT